MDIPFRLRVFLGKNDPFFFVGFSDNLAEAMENLESHCIVCKELQDFRIQFEAEDINWALWIELMDILPIQEFSEQEKETFMFNPNSKIRPLYLNISSEFNISKTEYIPFLPGLYRITILKENRSEYYAFLKVESLHIDENQLIMLRNDVEEKLTGLARDVITRRQSMFYKEDQSDLIEKYHFLVNVSDELISNLAIIRKAPRFNIQKRYTLKAVGLNRKDDMKTLRHTQSNLKNQHKTLTYDYDMTYDINLNNNLKEMLINILKIIKEVEHYIIGNIDLLQVEFNNQKKYNSPVESIKERLNEIKTNEEKLKKLKANIYFLLNQEWLKGLKANMNSQDKLPRVPHYRFIYYVHQKIKKGSDVRLNPFQKYLYVWKETSKLYEIWGFLEVLYLLKDNETLNFTDIQGWIYDEDTKVLPLLKPETEISLKNENGLQLKLRYDSFIFKDGKLSTFENPIATMHPNNRPDLRIDIYFNNKFKKCIIIDFKYRSRNVIGNQKKYERNPYSKEMKVYRQLLSYSQVRSFYINRTASKRKEDSESAITKVFSLFPTTMKKNWGSLAYVEEELSDIILCELSPGKDNPKFQNKILDIIEDYID